MKNSAAVIRKLREQNKELIENKNLLKIKIDEMLKFFNLENNDMSEKKPIFFRSIMQKVPRDEYKNIRNTIIEKCEISLMVFYNWQSGITAIPKHQRRIVAEVLGCAQEDLLNTGSLKSKRENRKTENLGFRKIYYSIPRGLEDNHKKVRKLIMEKCKINVGVFYNWLKRKTPIPEHLRTIVAEILNCQPEELI